MGGGYDRCEDTDNGSSGANNSCASTKGNRIYVIDSNTGVLLKTFTTVRGVAGAITPVTDNNGLLTYAYAADTGGNLYRISGASAADPIGSTAPSNWNITRIAALGCDDGGSSCTRNRKFLFGPDVVAIPGGGYAALIGSGDREKPLGSGTYGASNNVQNHFFRVDDQPSNNAWLSQENSTCGGALLCRDSLTPIPANSNPTSSDLANRKGWYLPLASTENVVTSAITVSDTVTFSTFKPAIYDANACSGNLGEANVYNINYSNGAPAVGLTRYQRITGDGLPPSPVAGKVILDDGTVVPFLIGGSGTSPLEGGSPAASSNYTAPKGRVYWHVKQ
jgi:type IV pilus assembly protein PilY1